MIEEFLYYGIPHLYCKVDTVCWNVTDMKWLNCEIKQINSMIYVMQE